MLQGLRRGPKEPASIDPIDWLLDCHARIRRFTELSARLAEAEGVQDGEIRDAAQGLVRYFTIALPLHAEDEDRSLAPRMLAKAPPAEIEEMVLAMQREHDPIHAALDELVPCWRRLIDEPARLIDLSPTLREGAGRLEELFAPHLAKEEAAIFAWAREHLDQAELAEIGVEMRARRKDRSF